MTQQETPERLTREEKKARTRAQLIDAAAAVFARRGFVAASLDEVAEEAGLTKGAVYSNFDSKEDLFQAVIDDRLNEPMRHGAEDIEMSTGTTEEHAMAGARAVHRRRRAGARGVPALHSSSTFTSLGTRNCAPQYAARSREQLAQVAGLIREALEELGHSLPLPADQMAIASRGVVPGHRRCRSSLNPEGVPDDLLGRMYALLFQLPAES